MVKRNISFYGSSKEIITKTWILHEKKSSYYEYYGFLGVKRGLFERKKLVGRSYYLQNLHDILRTDTDDLSVLKKLIGWYFM